MSPIGKMCPGSNNDFLREGTPSEDGSRIVAHDRVSPLHHKTILTDKMLPSISLPIR